MRKLTEAISMVALATLVGVTVWTVARDWVYLTSIGGWFAVLGQLLAVFATLIMVVIVVTLAAALLALPFILCSLAVTRTDTPQTLPAIVRTITGIARRQVCSLGRKLFAVVNYGWKILWWGQWYLRLFFRQLFIH